MAVIGFMDWAIVAVYVTVVVALGVFFGRPSGILLACSDEQKQRYLLPAVKGEKFDCLAMTEPNAGSDVRGMKCSARRDGGDWLINGSKHFISHANVADFVIVFVATGEEETSRMSDFIEDGSAVNPQDAILYSNLAEGTRRVLATLAPREEQVLKMRFGIGERSNCTLEEVGQDFAVTRERIRQIEAKALRKLRHPTRSRKLKSYIES